MTFVKYQVQLMSHQVACLRPQSLTVKFYDHLWCIKYESKQACKSREEAMIIDNYIYYLSLARYRYDALISNNS